MTRDAIRGARRFTIGLVVATVVAAQPTAAEDREVLGGVAPRPVPLDRLLRLPSGVSFEVKTRGGLTRREWRERFTKITDERDEAKLALTESQDKLSEIASKTAGWNLGTPGTSSGQVDPGTPLSFELNQQIRRQKRDLKKAEVEFETLKVEANMSKVPDDWRTPILEPETAATIDDF